MPEGHCLGRGKIQQPPRHINQSEGESRHPLRLPELGGDGDCGRGIG